MVLDFAIKDGKIRSNPCAGVELPSAASPEMLFLTAAQVRALAAAIDERWSSKPRARIRRDGPPPFGLLVEFAAFTGLRAGETLEPIPRWRFVAHAGTVGPGTMRSVEAAVRAVLGMESS